MKKFLVTVLILAVLGGSGYAAWIYLGPGGSGGSNADNVVFVDAVSMITGLEGGNGLNNRYNGVIEPQETWKVEQSQDKVIEEMYVEVGDVVKEGQELFKYDTTESQNSLAQAEIDLERTANDIENTKAQIEELKVAQAKAGADEQLNYTIEIQTAENTVKRTEYEQKSKAVEIEQLKKTIENSVVTSEIDGVVKAINTDYSSSNSYSGEPDPLITILATGDYRVKGTVNEQNIPSLMLGSRVIVHSRVDENQIWRGTLDSIDMENASSNQSDMYYYSGSSSNNSSTYPFYVVLDDDEGLMLGQHVYIEMDNGQMDVKSGMWLESYYIVQEEGSEPYVWASNSKNKLEKRFLTLGEFDEDTQQYEILDGLTLNDYITYPSQGLEEGMPTTHNIDEATFGMNMDTGEYNSEDFGSYDYDDDWYDSFLASDGDAWMDDILEGDFADEGAFSDDQFFDAGVFSDEDLSDQDMDLAEEVSQIEN
ncbi:MAG: efflux RND transporter periplasmic adaptor subunit [Lachnospiraceae bacterium]|nr:efflux RND transporter periplasmic adaptor subunit [Robinsoniella sp.]MDY3767019.1 efflux RND transporter periplasmic adaptor subunit [Lachnospiraceae bacterium]